MFSIDYRSRTPIYQQIITNIETLAARGILPPDSQLPSVRALAVELSINPNTIAKAYGELEARGIIYSLPGRGSFISSDGKLLREQGIEHIGRRLAEAAADSAKLGIDREEFLAMAGKAWQGVARHRGKEGFEL